MSNVLEPPRYRYDVTPPVSGGFQWWCVYDRDSTIQVNFVLAMISTEFPGAENVARELARRLNDASR